MAVDAPAGPPPITRTSASVAMLSERRARNSVRPNACGEETMRKRQRATFFKLPLRMIAGPSGRNFLARKTSRDTLDGILPCDGIRSENADQTTAKLRKPVATRFTRDKRLTSGYNPREKHAQVRILKVM